MRKLFCILMLIGITLFFVIFFIEPAIAGPGGKIASAMFRTFWGKVILACLIILFLPLIIYNLIKEWIATRRTLKDLQRLAKFSDIFDWLTLRDRIFDSFFRVHAGWRKEDMKEASEWMTDWYWQNQQIAFLDQWANNGLVNHCAVRGIGDIKPLFLRYRGENMDHEGSRIVVSIIAEMEDYLAKRDTGEVVEGKKGFTDVKTVWSFILKDKKWRVANIEDNSMWLNYANLPNELPDRLEDVLSANKQITSG